MQIINKINKLTNLINRYNKVSVLYVVFALYLGIKVGNARLEGHIFIQMTVVLIILLAIYAIDTLIDFALGKIVKRMKNYIER